MARTFRLTADGGSRGNPGPAAYGAVVSENGQILAELFETIGTATNNVAEYSGLLAGLTHIHQLDPNANVEVAMDSKLVVEQMSGRWQIKHADMRELAKKCRDAHDASLVTYKWIPRDENSHADRLANKALDGDKQKVAPAQKPRINFLHERLTSGEVPTTIYMVRHGETTLTPEKRFSGFGGSDPQLSDRGRQQAAHVATELLARKPDVLIASPMVRTRETAEIINELLKLDIIFDDGWVEQSFGRWDGLKASEVEEQFPEEHQDWLTSTSAHPGGGESYEEVQERMEYPLEVIAHKYPGKKVVVVTHNVVIRAIACIVTGAPIQAVFHMDIPPCSITSISIWPSDGLRALRTLGEVNYSGQAL